MHSLLGETPRIVRVVPKLIAAGGALPMDARLANLTLIADRGRCLEGDSAEEKIH